MTNLTYLHIHLISDSTGETLTTIARAALARFENASAIEHYHPLVRNSAQLDQVLSEIKNSPGIVMHTIVDEALSEKIDQHCKDLGIPSVPVLAPIFGVFQSYLNTTASYRIGGQHALDADYFRRIDALNFSMVHDDGQLPEDIDEADVIIVGISRTSKTPTSIYLANRGLKVTNLPLVPGIEVNPILQRAKKPLIVCLVAKAEHIVQIRQNRIANLNPSDSSSDYVDRRAVAREIAFSRQLSAENGWPLIDVTRRSIEETAAEIYSQLRDLREEQANSLHAIQ